MRASYNGQGELTIHVGDILSALPDADKIGLIDTLSCEDAIIKHVADQILDGWTEQMSRGREEWPTRGNPSAPLAEARRRVALGAGEVAAEEVKRLQAALIKAEARVAELETDERNAWTKVRQHW